MQSSDWRKWRRAVRPALDAITADDRSTEDAGPVRIIFDFEISAPCHAGFAGVAGELFAVAFRRVPSFTAGKPGPTMLVNTASIENELESDAEILMAANAVVCHELAHFFDHPNGLRGFLPSVAPDEIVLDLVQAKLAELPDSDAIQHDRLGIDHARFIRRTLHIAYRLEQRGWIVPIAWLHDWRLSQAIGASLALADELKSLDGLPLRRVDAIVPPADFVELFEDVLKSDEPAIVEAA